MQTLEAIPAQAVAAGDRRRTDRRARPTSPFSRFALFGGRRRGDRRNAASPNAYVDLYEPWLAATLVGIGVLCALDAIFTLVYLQRGGTEANPIMDWLIGKGPQVFVLVKCGVTNLGLAVLCLHKNFRFVKAVIGVLFVVYALLFLYHLYLVTVVR